MLRVRITSKTKGMNLTWMISKIIGIKQEGIELRENNFYCPSVHNLFHLLNIYLNIYIYNSSVVTFTYCIVVQKASSSSSSYFFLSIFGTGRDGSPFTIYFSLFRIHSQLIWKMSFHSHTQYPFLYEIFVKYVNGSFAIWF